MSITVSYCAVLTKDDKVRYLLKDFISGHWLASGYFQEIKSNELPGAKRHYKQYWRDNGWTLKLIKLTDTRTEETIFESPNGEAYP